MAMYDTYLGPAAGAYPSRHYSGLESAVREAAPSFPGRAGQSYEINQNGAYAAASATPQLQHAYTSSAAITTWETAGKAIYDAQPVAFLNPSRPSTPFIAESGHILDLVREAFLATTQQQLPADIAITVAQRRLLQHIHSQFSNPSVVGLSLNATREIFAVAASLDAVMLVIGHELGHILSPTLTDRHAEEAKAFAFEAAWAKAIFEQDIGGFSSSINSAALDMKPAPNGLHDLAFAFVKAAVVAGKEPLSLHSELSAEKVDFGSDLAATPGQAITYVPLSKPMPGYHSFGYLNKSSVQNVPWLQNFTWADLGTGTYGMYLPMTASIFMNEKLLRNNLEQFHKTLGHEYVLHHVMQLPDGYVVKILEETIFWIKDEEKHNRQGKP